MTLPDRGSGDPGTGRPGGEDIDVWAAIGTSRAWLDEHNGTAVPELSLRILKIVEEAGEAAAAWIGTLGQNPRKGVTHSRQDVADELGDVAFTALVAAASLGHDPHKVLARIARKATARIPATPPPVPTGRPERGADPDPA
ncbi:MazG nucleotide pyrophosphohydrolase domain-containing protein [Actinoplanes sp. NPDC000266]